MREMVVAIDYDNTWTLDPALWGAFCHLLRGRGHRVILCSQRPPDHECSVEVCVAVDGQVDGVVLCSGKSKRQAAAEQGWAVDVWVDDFPVSVEEAMIFNTKNWEQLREERGVGETFTEEED